MTSAQSLHASSTCVKQWCRDQILQKGPKMVTPKTLHEDDNMVPLREGWTYHVGVGHHICF
jgi:hypothetical protein